MLTRIAISFLGLLGLSFGAPVHSQLSIDQLMSDFAFYSDVMTNVQSPDHRYIANEMVNQAFDQLMQESSSFDIDLSENKWIYTYYAPDSSFRVISWQCELADDQYTYRTIVQKKSGELYELNNSAELSDDATFEAFDTEYGTDFICYGLYEISQSGEAPQYLMFGYKQLDQFTKVKLVDVLTFDDAFSPVFDSDVFVSEPDTRRPIRRNRLILSYSSDASIKLNYNENLDLIIFDNLISRMGQMPGQGNTNVPDGSYSAYERQANGDWLFVDKLYKEILDEAPVPVPARNNDRSTSITGGKRRSN